MIKPAELKPILDNLGGYDRPTIHIAGTKGKGTTTMLLAEILRVKGKRVGQFISPYILDERECLQINGEMISEKDFASLRLRVPQTLSPFEQRTLMALIYFQENKCDFVVLETGWGGRDDATNIVESKALTILTHIELEHTSSLGTSLEEIINKKLGITRPGVPLICSVNISNDLFKIVDSYELETLLAPDLRLGNHHPESAGLAILAAEKLGYSLDEAELNHLERLSLPGRFEILKHGIHSIILDGAHTPDSVDFVLKQVQEYMIKNEISDVTWAIHFLKDKSDTLSERFAKTNTVWIPIEDDRAGLNPSEHKTQSIQDLLTELDTDKNPRLIVIMGSFKLIAAFKKSLS